MLTREEINTADAIAETFEKWGRRKIVVGGFDVECIRFGKIVHIQTVSRFPKVHDDGRVTIRAFNDEYEIKAQRITLDSTGQSWISFNIA